MLFLIIICFKTFFFFLSNLYGKVHLANISANFHIIVRLSTDFHIIVRLSADFHIIVRLSADFHIIVTICVCHL